MCIVFFFQAEDGIRDLVRSRGLGDVYKRQKFLLFQTFKVSMALFSNVLTALRELLTPPISALMFSCLLYTSDAADERSSVDLGGRRIIKKKKKLTIDARLISRSQRLTT